MDLRGEAVAVFDSSSSSGDLQADRCILIIREESRSVGIIVDDVLNTVEVDESAVSTQEVGQGKKLTVVRLEAELLSVFDPLDIVENSK